VAESQRSIGRPHDIRTPLSFETGKKAEGAGATPGKSLNPRQRVNPFAGEARR